MLKSILDLKIQRSSNQQMGQIKQNHSKFIEFNRRILIQKRGFVCFFLFTLGIGIAANIGPGVHALGYSSQPDMTSSGSSLEIAWSMAGTSQVLKKWSFGEISQFKHKVSREKDPHSRRMVKWEGALLQNLVENALEQLPLENRAQVDLVILRGKDGQNAFVPRALITKYPLLLAYRKEDVGSHLAPTTFQSVVPWSSKPKILNEELPLESFFIPQVSKIELTNYRDKYSTLFLKRRTDPSAIRGEKLFVQNCVCCHSVGYFSRIIQSIDGSLMKEFALNGSHLTSISSFKLSEKDRKSVIRYLDAHRNENPVEASNGVHSVQAERSSKLINAQ